MDPRPTIRIAQRADEAALGALERRTWSTLHSVQPRPLSPYAPFFDASHRPAHFLVAELTGEREGLAGYIRMVPPTPLACHAHVRQIQGLVVDEWARGRGVARALLDAACERARDQGAVRLTLRVLGHNVPARELYASAGFAVEGVLPAEFVLDGQYVDDVLMGRWLRPDTGYAGQTGQTGQTGGGARRTFTADSGGDPGSTGRTRNGRARYGEGPPSAPEARP